MTNTNTVTREEAAKAVKEFFVTTLKMENAVRDAFTELANGSVRAYAEQTQDPDVSIDLVRAVGGASKVLKALSELNNNLSMFDVRMTVKRDPTPAPSFEVEDPHEVEGLTKVA